MKTLPARANAGNRRRIKYIDETLQKWFLIVLVALEAGLAAGLAWLMFRHLNQIVDDNLYRVHLADTVPMLTQLIHQALILLALFFATNLLLLALVHFVWGRHVHSIFRLFMELMGKTRRLDFSADPEISDLHRVLDLTEAQREQDRIRLTEIRKQLAGLEQSLPETKPDQDAHAVLRAINELLPAPRADGQRPPPRSSR